MKRGPVKIAVEVERPARTDPDGGDAASRPLPFGSPYAAGFGLGLTLLLSFWILGAGLGASGGLARVAAWAAHLVSPARVRASAYFGAWFGEGRPHVLAYYLVFMGAGVFVGGLLSALVGRRIRPSVERGPRISAAARLGLALLGGALVGFSTRLARGCTSGQALTGTALLFTGSVVFLVCTFAGAYAVGLAVRRQWR